MVTEMGIVQRVSLRVKAVREGFFGSVDVGIRRSFGGWSALMR